MRIRREIARRTGKTLRGCISDIHVLGPDPLTGKLLIPSFLIVRSLLAKPTMSLVPHYKAEFVPNVPGPATLTANAAIESPA